MPAKPDPIEIDLKKTAFIVVDMQNAFAKKGGMLDVLGADISGAASVIINIGKILEKARRTEAAIIYLKMGYNPDLSNGGGPQSPHWHKERGLVMMNRNAEYKGKFLIRGTWDEQIVDELKPHGQDLVVRKSRYSGFRNTDLDQLLKSRHITHLVFVGITTNICVESTLRDAFFLDYWPILISDAVNNAGPIFTQQATLWMVENALGWVTSTADVLRVLPEISDESVNAVKNYR